MFESYKFGKYKIAYEKCLKLCGDDSKCLKNVSEKFMDFDFTIPKNTKIKSVKKSKSKKKSVKKRSPKNKK
jgi:hypothetical protein